MKPEQFIKDQGIHKAKERLKAAKESGLDMWTYGWGFTTKQLEKLVQSLELIEQIGGVEVAKGKVFIADFNGFKMINFLIGNEAFVVHIKRVQEAIADHEAVHGNEIDPLSRLKAGLTKLRDNFINDAQALTLLGDMDKARVYNGIASQLDGLLKGGA